MVVHKEWRGLYMKRSVFSASRQQFQKIGAHIIVGYHDFNKIKNLVEKGGVGGVFISRHNIQGKTFLEVKEELAELQAIQKKHGRPPLLIATDHEGGIVSKLSPLLTPLPSLAKVVNQSKNINERNMAIKDYAKIHASELASIGVNVNFGPVVDLKNIQTKVKFDTHSLISKRAISHDPKVVSEVATIYANTLEKYGVLATLKHFPGLGKIKQDTHFMTGVLETDIEQLMKTDWVPFNNVTKNSHAMMMVGHVRLSQIDKDNPVSISKTVIQDIIRNKMNYKGLIVTDDFSMGPIYSRPGGIGKAAVKSLQAGVDLILISYDPGLYYTAMHALMEADLLGKLPTKTLKKSALRISSATQKILLAEKNNTADEAPTKVVTNMNRN